MLFYLLIFIIFINIKLYVQAFFILHYLYILACLFKSNLNDRFK